MTILPSKEKKYLGEQLFCYFLKIKSRIMVMHLDDKKNYTCIEGLLCLFLFFFIQ